jgi:hypothetical protein
MKEVQLFCPLIVLNELDIFTAIKIRALHAVLERPGEYTIRHIQRWYSKTFSTPLQEVQDIPIEEVLEAFYEELYEDQKPEDREEARLELIETPQEIAQRLLDEGIEEVEDEQFHQEAVEEAKKAKEAPLATAEQSVQAMEQQLCELEKQLQLPKNLSAPQEDNLESGILDITPEQYREMILSKKGK